MAARTRRVGHPMRPIRREPFAPPQGTHEVRYASDSGAIADLTRGPSWANLGHLWPPQVPLLMIT
jgi:hypothetical protein